MLLRSIHAFFAHHIHATRLFHAPTFYASLDLHPSDSQFPCKAILHAICAVGSMYTSSLSPQVAITESYPCMVHPSSHEVLNLTHCSGDPVTGVKRKGKKRITSFGSEQAKFAKEAIEEALDLGEKLFENTQG